MSCRARNLGEKHPNIAIVYRRKVERFTGVLADSRDEAADTIRSCSSVSRYNRRRADP